MLLATAFAQLGSAERQELLLAEERGVELLADRPIAQRALFIRLEVSREVVERLRGLGAGFGQALLRRRVRDLGRHELARVARRGPRLTDRALCIHTRRPREVEIRDAVLDVRRHAIEPLHRGVGELALGA